MPRHDPIPRVREAERAALWVRFRRTMMWMGVVAVATIAAALAYLFSAGGPVTIHMVIATILGVGLSVLVGTGLMALVFLSNASGHDEEAARAAAHVEDDGSA